MRVGYAILVAFAALLSSTDADSISANAIAKSKFSITNTNSSDAMDGVFVQEGSDKFLVLHLKDDAASDNTSTDEDDGSSKEDESGSDGQEERAAVSAGATDKLKKTFPGKYNTKWNKFWWKFWNARTPKDSRLPDPPRLPPRLRQHNFATN